jgi:arabinofuranosyltransferase
MSDNTTALPRESSPDSRAVVLVVILAAFLVVLLRTAWVCDDAYITFRTVDNLVHGHGLRWNVGERVQVFTHPLWLMLFTPVYAVTREAFHSVIALSIALTLIGVSLLYLRVAVTPAAGLLAAMLLFFSKAFVDFSTSGLENPLSHLLLIAFAIAFLQWPPGAPFSRRRASVCALIAGFAFLTRPDQILIYLPALAGLPFLIRRDAPFGRTILVLPAAFTPVIAWELFSLVYYGFPLPNSAYAKIVTGEGLDAAIRTQGALYFLNSVDVDPITLLGALAGIGAAVVLRQQRLLLLAGGVALYLGYVYSIGGDFMSGRFFTIALLAGAILLARFPWEWRLPWSVAIPLAVVLIVSHGGPSHPEIAGGDSGRAIYPASGVVDERLFWFQTNGLVRANPLISPPTDRHAQSGRDFRQTTSQRRVIEHPSVGTLGYFAGPNLHIVDFYGLTDPFIARMPAIAAPGFRPGHVHHYYPRDYVASVEQDRNLLRDDGLGRYYNRLKSITSGPIWSRDRFEAIFKMNTGQYDAWVEDYRPVWPLSDLGGPVEDGAWWEAAGHAIIGSEGVEIDLEQARHNAAIDFSLGGDDGYGVLFNLEDREVGRLWLPAVGGSGMVNRRADVPPEAVTEGYDRLRIVPLGGDGRYSIGHIILR